MDTEVTRTEIDASGRVAEEIRALLARRRMSGRELARKLDVSPSWVSYRLTGTQPIDINDLVSIAKVLGVKASDIIANAERGDGAYGDVGDLAITIPTVRVGGTTAHPAHPIVTAAVPLPRRGSTHPPDRRPANRTDTPERRTAPTGR